MWSRKTDNSDKVPESSGVYELFGSRDVRIYVGCSDNLRETIVNIIKTRRYPMVSFRYRLGSMEDARTWIEEAAKDPWIDVIT